MDRLTCTVTEAAGLLGISRGAAYEAARSGQLPTLRIGKRLLVPIGALHKLLDQTQGIAVSESTEATR
jgi:excisionase family DNA binding protein